MNQSSMTGLITALLRVVIILPVLILVYTLVAFQPHIVLGQWLGLTSLDWSLLNLWVSVGFGLIGVTVLFWAFRRVDHGSLLRGSPLRGSSLRDSPLQSGIVVTAWAAMMLAAPVVDLTRSGSGLFLPAWLGRYLETIGGIVLRGNRIAESYWPLASLAALVGLALIGGLVLIGLGVLDQVHRFLHRDAGVRKVERTRSGRWATHTEIGDIMGTTGIVVGERSNPLERKTRFDPGTPSSWGKQGKSPLIHLDPARGNGHILAFSSSGTFKTSGLVIPNALTYRDQIVVIDPKGEIYEASAATRRSMGRRPVKIDATNGLDPFRLLGPLLKTDPGLYPQLASFMFSPKGQMRSVDAFFEAHSNKLAAALIAHFDGEGSRDIPRDIYRLISRDSDTFSSLVEAIATDAEDKNLDHIAFPMNQFRGTGKEHTSNEDTKKTLANAVAFAAYPNLRSWLVQGPDSPSADELVASDVDLYIAMPTNQMKAHAAIVRLILGAIYLLFDHHEGARRSGRHRLFMLDEANALGRMPMLEATRDEGRAKGLHLMQIFQSHQQLVEHYGQHGASAWEQGTDLRLWGPVADMQSARALATMIGQESVKTRSHSTRHSSAPGAPVSNSVGGGTSDQLRDMALMDEAELRALPPETMIVFHTGLRPFVASKAVWFARPEWRKLKEKADREYPEPARLEAVASSPPPPPAETEVATGPSTDPKDTKLNEVFAELYARRDEMAAARGTADGPDGPRADDARKTWPEVAATRTARAQTSEKPEVPATGEPPVAEPAARVQSTSPSPVPPSPVALPESSAAPVASADRGAPALDGSGAEDAETSLAEASTRPAANVPDEKSEEPEPPFDGDMIQSGEEDEPSDAEPSEDNVSVEAGPGVGAPQEAAIEPEPTLAAEVVTATKGKPARRPKRGEAAELAQLRLILPAKSDWRACMKIEHRSDEAPPTEHVNVGAAAPAEAMPAVSDAASAQAARFEDLLEAVGEHSSRDTKLASLIHGRRAVYPGSREAQIAAKLPRPEGAELGIVLPGTLAPTDKWVDETSLIVFDGDEVTRYVLDEGRTQILTTDGPHRLSKAAQAQLRPETLQAHTTEVKLRGVAWP